MPLTTPLTREAQAARDLLAAYKDIIGDDEAFAMDVVEGQTSLIEVVNALIPQEGEDKAHIKALGAYIDAVKARKARLEDRVEKRRTALIRALLTAGLKGPLRCPLGTVSLTNAREKAIPTDEAVIPAEFWKNNPVLDRVALLAALKEGRKIPGAELSNGGVSISIRTT